ncbi:MAG: hypothetical protein U9M90_04840 [Patescibacteria group bacterium]|nr:hypothetical protein [Patescibacteria group bacterium]
MIDIISVLIEQPDFKKAKSYWVILKNRLKEEGSELVAKCDQLKMLAQDKKNKNQRSDINGFKSYQEIKKRN